MLLVSEILVKDEFVDEHIKGRLLLSSAAGIHNFLSP